MPLLLFEYVYLLGNLANERENDFMPPWDTTLADLQIIASSLRKTYKIELFVKQTVWILEYALCARIWIFRKLHARKSAHIVFITGLTE